jgi:hypothetical protein
MEAMVWMGGILLYIVLLFTVCMVCFRKGHTILAVLGIFLPILWFVGAAMSPTESSNYQR